MSRHVEVKVINGNIEKALKILKKKLQNDGFFKILKLKKYYEKPSEARSRKKRESIRRVRKMERLAAKRKRFIRPNKKRKPDETR